MPKTKSGTKSSLIGTRLTSEIKEIITQVSAQEGITSSEWLRNLIIKELRSIDALPMVFIVPKLDEDNPEQE